MRTSRHDQSVIDNKLGSKTEVGSIRRAWNYALRAIRWRCPVCGISPLFLSVGRVEGITDWFDMLDGCPRCDYDYHREPGYFLLALWIINFWIVAIVGLVQVVILDRLFDISTAALIFVILITMWLLGILTARHTKAFFLALDHLVHPHPDDAKKPGN